VTGALAINSTATYAVTLFGTGANDISRVNMTGATAINSGALITLDLSALSAAQVDALRGDVGIGNTRTYTVMSGVGAANFSPANFSIANQGNFAAGEWTFDSTPDAGTVQLNFTPVPEPATVLGVAAGALGLGGFVRRRLRGGSPAAV
jgi:hypothetical protein